VDETTDQLARLTQSISDDADEVAQMYIETAAGIDLLVIEYTVEDNGFFGLGALDEMSDIVQDISKSDIEYDVVRLVHNAGLENKLGELRFVNAFIVDFNHETLDRIDWERFDYEDILDIADDLSFVNSEVVDAVSSRYVPETT
jgi:hypothetical protein